MGHCHSMGQWPVAGSNLCIFTQILFHMEDNYCSYVVPSYERNPLNKDEITTKSCLTAWTFCCPTFSLMEYLQMSGNRRNINGVI